MLKALKKIKYAINLLDPYFNLALRKDLESAHAKARHLNEQLRTYRSDLTKIEAVLAIKCRGYEEQKRIASEAVAAVHNLENELRITKAQRGLCPALMN
ncbi:MAG: hypothetical protein AAFQ32_04465 [Pseudomonadota bacterium]